MQKLWEKLPQNISMINVLRLRLLVSSVLLINMTSLCYITRRHITWLLYVRDVILHYCVTWRSWRHFTQLCYVTFMTSHYVMLRYMTSHDAVMLCLLRYIRHVILRHKGFGTGCTLLRECIFVNDSLLYGLLKWFIITTGPVEQLPDYNRVRGGMYWTRL